MAELHVVTALVAKRAELSGDLVIYERRDAIKAHITNLDAVLRLFCYAGDPAKIKPKRKRNWLFRRIVVKGVCIVYDDKHNDNGDRLCQIPNGRPALSVCSRPN